MQKILLLLLIACFVSKSHAQKLNLKDLHIMSTNKNWETTNKYVLSQGWEFNDSHKGDDERYNVISWTFDKSGTETERAKGWLTVYSYDGLPNKVLYRFRAKEFYTLVRAQLNTYSYKLQNEEILDQRVIAHYSNADFLLDLEYIRVDDDDYSYDGSYTVYNVTVSKKGGVFDPNNGKKNEFDENGNVTAEYSLKNGEINGLFKVFYPDGAIRKTVSYVNGAIDGLSTEYLYDENGVLVGKYSGNLTSEGKQGKWQTIRLNDDFEVPMEFKNYSNDVREGPFREVSNDSVAYGNYRNGKLHGKYDLFIDINRMVLGGFVNTDSIKLKKVSEGHFIDDKKSGKWKSYDLADTMIAEGLFSNDLKSGLWKYYYSTATDNPGKIADYSGKLFLEETYYAGKIHGSITRYSYLVDIEVPCDDNQQNCTTKKFVPIFEQTQYFHDVREGPYELRSESGEILRKGQFANDLEEGVWSIRNTSIVNSFKGISHEKGAYIAGKKVGKWQRFDEDGSLLEVYTYLNSQLDGEHLLYINNRLIEKRKFNHGNFVELSLLDNSLNEVSNYKIEDVKHEKYRCIKTERLADGVHRTTFSIKRSSNHVLSPVAFNLEFESLPITLKIFEGIYSHTALDGKILQEGAYVNNEKVGLWATYYYQQFVRADYQYDAYGNLIGEFYANTKDGKPFNGEFVFQNESESNIEERKIRDGLRNGTTKTKGLDGKTIKKESYKDGIIKV